MARGKGLSCIPQKFHEGFSGIMCRICPQACASGQRLPQQSMMKIPWAQQTELWTFLEAIIRYSMW